LLIPAGSKESIFWSFIQKVGNIEELPLLLLFWTCSRYNVGAGLSFISDKVGPVTEQNVFGDFSYTLKIK
jgi:hypothetical protein